MSEVEKTHKKKSHKVLIGLGVAVLIGGAAYAGSSFAGQSGWGMGHGKAVHHFELGYRPPSRRRPTRIRDRARDRSHRQRSRSLQVDDRDPAQPGDNGLPHCRPGGTCDLGCAS